MSDLKVTAQGGGRRTAMAMALGGWLLSGSAMAATASVEIDPTVLTYPAGVTAVRITETGNEIGARTRLPLRDGNYTVTTVGASNRVFGSFVVSSGNVASVTGSLMRTAVGVTFDISRLSPVTIEPGSLSRPAGMASVQLVEARTQIYGSTTFFLPTGGYTISTGGTLNQEYGSFVVSSGSVTSTSGVLVASSSSVIDFDVAHIAAVTIDPSSLTAPAGMQSIQLVETRSQIYRSTEFYLPSGNFTISTGGTFDHVFGSFSVSGTRISGTQGALMTSASGIDFDLGKLAAVSLDPTMLSAPIGGQTVSLVETRTQLARDTRFYLPDGSYSVSVANDFGRTFGNFAVASGKLARSTGALELQHERVAFKACQLTWFKVEPKSGVYWQVPAVGAAWSSNIADILLPAGAYDVELQRSGISHSGSLPIGADSITSLTIADAVTVSIMRQACASANAVASTSAAKPAESDNAKSEVVSEESGGGCSRSAHAAGKGAPAAPSFEVLDALTNPLVLLLVVALRKARSRTRAQT